MLGWDDKGTVGEGFALGWVGMLWCDDKGTRRGVHSWVGGVMIRVQGEGLAPWVLGRYNICWFAVSPPCSVAAIKITIQVY